MIKELSYVDTFYRPISDKLDDLRLLSEGKFVPIISREIEMLIRTLLFMRRPKKLLEIGTAVGYSASVFASYIMDLHIDTIEISEESAAEARLNFQFLNIEDRINVIQGNAVEILTTLNGNYDFIFIDAAKSHYRKFFDEALRLSSSGTIILCDNILYKGLVEKEILDVKRRNRTIVRGLKNFLSYISDLDTVETAVLDLGDGVSISVVK